MSFYLNGQLYDSSNASDLYDQSGHLKSGSELISGSSSPVIGAGSTALGSFQNALDMITQQSEKASARSLEYAQQNQQWSAQQAEIARNFNSVEAAKNRDWQEYMSNSAHQREIADLKAAGLNPVLSAMGGNGAAVTSGASASATLPTGASGQSDTSVNSALVSILGSMLAAQTSLTNQAVSARTEEAVADKYNAMSRITAEIAAAASMSNARTSAAASMANASTAAAASRYSAEKGYLAHLEGISDQFLNEKWLRENYPSNTLGALSSIFHDLFGYRDSGVDGKLYDFADALWTLNDKWMKGLNGRNSGRGSR